MDATKKRTSSEPELDAKRSNVPFSIAIHPSEPVIPLNVIKKQKVLLTVTPRNELPSCTYRVVIVVDDSVSMAGKRSDMADRIVRDVFDHGISKSVPFEKTHIGVVVFGTQVEEQLGRELSPLTNLDAWTAKLRGNSGQTNIFAGVSRAVEMFDDAAAPDESTQDHIVLLTDGNANLGECRTGSQIRENCIGDRLIGLHCIALGDQPERHFVETLVDDGKFGLFAFANTPSGLPNAYETVFMSICNTRGLMDVEFRESGLSSAILSERVGILMSDTFRMELPHSTLSMSAPKKIWTIVELKVNNQIVAQNAFYVEAVSCPPSEQPVDASYKTFLKERELKNNMLQAINRAPTLRVGHAATKQLYEEAVASSEFDTHALQRMNAMMHSVEASVAEEQLSEEVFSYRSIGLLSTQMSSQRY